MSKVMHYFFRFHISLTQVRLSARALHIFLFYSTVRIASYYPTLAACIFTGGCPGRRINGSDVSFTHSYYAQNICKKYGRISMEFMIATEFLH